MNEQLNLRHSMVDEFWGSQDPRLARIIAWMDNSEDWMLDERPDVMEALNALGKKMSSADPRTLSTHFDPLLDVLAYMSSSRALRILEWLDRAHGGALSLRLVQKAMERPDARAQILIDRLQTLRSLSMLGNIFSQQRITRIIQLLEQNR